MKVWIVEVWQHGESSDRRIGSVHATEESAQLSVLNVSGKVECEIHGPLTVRGMPG